MFLPRLSKPGRLLHIHLLLEVAIQERHLDVHVVDLPTFMRRQRQQQLHRLHASHRREHLVVVDPVMLCVPFDDEPRLVPYHSSMFIPLDLEHPLEPNGTPAKWELNECPRCCSPRWHPAPPPLPSASGGLLQPGPGSQAPPHSPRRGVHRPDHALRTQAATLSRLHSPSCGTAAAPHRRGRRPNHHQHLGKPRQPPSMSQGVFPAPWHQVVSLVSPGAPQAPPPTRALSGSGR